MERVRAKTAELRAAGVRSPKVGMVSPTGSGKTVMAAHMIHAAAAKGSKVLFMAPRRELIMQAQEKLTAYGVSHGLIIAGQSQRPLAETHIVSKDTLHSRCIRRSVMDAPKCDICFVDEFHLSMAKTFQEVFALWPEACFIGLSATPARNDGKGLGDFWDALVPGPTYEHLIDTGALAPTRVFAPYIPDMKGVATTAGDFNAKERERRMNKEKLVGDIVSTWKERAANRNTIVFASGIDHSIQIRDQFRAAGIPAEHVDGSMPTEERDYIMSEYRRGHYPVLTNCMVASYGFDAPMASCCILARPTKSLVLYRQMAGRVQRPYPGKEYALILDHSGACLMHGFPDDDIDWTLDKSVNNSEANKEKKEKEKDRLPICCKQCGFVFEWTPQRRSKCPNCGYENPSRVPDLIRSSPGELRELTRKKRLRNSTKMDKQRHWNSCVHSAAFRGLKIGAAAHQYRQHFGTWPANILDNVPRGKQQWNMLAQDWLKRGYYR